MGNTKVDLKQLEEFRDRVQKVADEEQQKSVHGSLCQGVGSTIAGKGY